MCGIVAMIAKDTMGFDFKSKTVFEQMLFANSLRGKDSTGVFGINKYGNLKMIKAAQQAPTFLQSKTAQEFIEDTYSKYKIVVGHNRATTKGATNDTNAHPFIEGDICLIHNGTLHSHKHLKDVEVDSHAICHAMAEKPYKEVLQELYGAFALIWYNAKEKILRIARNKERPLYIIETDRVDYIASEPEMMYWILERNGIKYEEAKYFDIKTIYSYNVDSLDKGFDTEEMPEKKFTPPAVLPTQRVGGQQLLVTITKQPQIIGKLLPSNYSNYYKYGNQMILKHDSNTIVNGKVIFRGTTEDDHEMPWVCTMDQNLADESLFNANKFFGRFAGASIKGQAVTLIVGAETLEAEKVYTSVTGEKVSESVFYTPMGLCSSCGAYVDPDEEPFWARVKKGVVKALKCSHCGSKDPFLRKHFESETINVC